MRPPIPLYTMIVLAAVPLAVAAQSAPCANPGCIRSASGTEPESRIDYRLISLQGALYEGKGDPPELTAQCTRGPGGKLRFELLAKLGDSVEPMAYFRPWMPQDGGLFPPQLRRVSVKMEFFGYTKVRPVKRQWELLEHPAGVLRYNNPSVDSANMEPFGFYLRYLLALPTLRLTASGHPTAEFQTATWLQQIKAEPICKAAGL